MTEPTFRLQDYASDFVTRDAGRLLREKLLALDASAPAEHRITVDAVGVSVMTPSFVDEFFGRTAALMGMERFRQRFRIVGIEGETRMLINNVVRNRMILDRQLPAV
jgi:hypothetical protein